MPQNVISHLFNNLYNELNPQEGYQRLTQSQGGLGWIDIHALGREEILSEETQNLKSQVS